MLRNLLSNAVKFTEQGGVELLIQPAAEDEVPEKVIKGGAVVAFHVKDTGIGIQEQQLESIFGAFQQADGTTSRKYGGTGLGLSITREIAHLLGGAVTVDSAPGRGSTFTLYLPVARPDFAQLAGRPRRSRRNCPPWRPPSTPPAAPRPGPAGRRRRRAGCSSWRSGPAGCSPSSPRASSRTWHGTVRRTPYRGPTWT
ncbi:hypothetical protein GCM10020295_13960 [Streptomyces cinereospinus]